MAANLQEDTQQDPQRGAAAAEAARRRAAARAERITAGLDDLELWLTDQVRTGLTNLRRTGYREIDEQARRLVDAQAPGVAAQVRELAGALSEEDWADRTLTEFALLHLLIRGWRHRDALPEPLAATVRRRIGLTMTGTQIARVGEHITDDWLVLGSRDQPRDKLIERRIWLHGTESRRIALLLSFAPPGQPLGLALPVGARFNIELVFAPEAVPLRAVVVHQGELQDQLTLNQSPPGEPPLASPAQTLNALAERLAAALAADPWTTGVPGVVARAEIGFEEAGDGWWVLDQAGSGMVPLIVTGEKVERMRYLLLAACAGRPAALFGEYRSAGFVPITVFADGQAVSV
jgi:hypothetical protein